MNACRGWQTLREIDVAAGLGKGHAFRRFKQLAAQRAEGVDYRVLDHRHAASEIETLHRQGRIHGHSVNVVLLAPDFAASVLEALRAAPPQPQRARFPSRPFLGCAMPRARLTMRAQTIRESFMSAAELLKNLPSAFNAAEAGGTDCTIQFNCSQPVHAVIKGGACSIVSGASDTADVTITMEDDDLVALMKGELNGMTAFMTGKLQIEGDLMLAQRLPALFDSSKL